MASPAPLAPELSPAPLDDLTKQPVAAVLAHLDVKPDQGLSAAEAAERLAKDGPNAIVGEHFQIVSSST